MNPSIADGREAPLRPGRMIDLEAYLARIGYTGPRTASLQTLRDLHRLHPAAIVFENIDVLLGNSIDLTPAMIDAKLIARGRGGYCFEQNSLFGRALRALGFDVENLIARSLWGRAPGDTPPRTHMALRVLVDGEPWLADVGFGGCMLTSPVGLRRRGPQRTLFQTVRVVEAGDELRLQALISGDWRPVCDLVAAPQADVDLIAANWFISTHPSSPFRRHLVVSRTTPQARYGLADAELTVRAPGETTRRRRLDAEGLEAVLIDLFGLPAEPGWRPVLAQAAGRTEALP